MRSKHEILSLEYLKAIANKLREQPYLLEKARSNLHQKHETHCHSTWITE